MTIQLTEELVNSVLPNTIITVDEEIPLSARIEPYVKDSIRWLESFVTGDVDLPPDLEEMAVRAVVLHAVIKAIPSLDLVVTPTGFGVISSSNLVPASKDRIERLISSLSSSLDDIVLLLQEKCVSCESWRNSARGRWYCSTFIPYLSDVSALRNDNDILPVHTNARGHALKIETMLAEDYLGYPLMSKLRLGFINGTYDKSHPVVSAIRAGILRYAAAHSRTAERFRCPDEHEVWHLAEHILRLVRQDPELQTVWENSMNDPFEVEPFKNTRRGGYFF
ncbi:MAG: hypothetical protein K2G13_01645 [Muribaculaceae bacterium]|nr:hypothetical protein [Muribaculaceae bacterium]